MKKIFLIFAAIAALAVSCQKAEPDDQTTATTSSSYAFDFNISGDSFGTLTKAEGTTGWTTGEKIFVFFQPQGGSLLEGYLTLALGEDGKWAYATSGIADGDLGTAGEMSAVYVPFLSDSTVPVYKDGGFTINGGDVYYSYAEAATYELSGTKVAGDLYMSIPAGYVQIRTSNSKAQTLTCNQLDAYECVSFGADGFKSSKKDSDEMSAHSLSSNDKFSYYYGKLKSDLPEDLEFSFIRRFYDPTTRTLPGTKLSDRMAYDLNSYQFSINKVESTFTNTTADASEAPAPSVTSTLFQFDGDDKSSYDWVIKSYQIGDADPVEVNGTSFAAGGLEVSNSNNNYLMIKALKKDASFDPGAHDYWVNTQGRTDNLDWSPADWTSKGVTDLSKYNFQTENATAMNTANCYVIRHGGTYKLPLVYGNAVKNGSENTVGYKPLTSSSAHAYWGTFKNHLEKDITSGFIENNTGCKAAGVKVIWQDKEEVIKNLSIVGDEATTYDAGTVRYLQFTVDQNVIRQNNAVVAVTDEAGNVMWSWHIWVTNDPGILESPISVWNYDNNEYKFFPVTALGWIEPMHFPGREDVTIILEQADSGETLTYVVHQPEVKLQSNATSYQWGRKDPMCTTDTPASGEFSIHTDNVNCDKDHPDNPGRLYDELIKNPGIYYGTTSGWGFSFVNYNEHAGNWWAGQFTTNNNTKEKGIENSAEFTKTIYDPSPVGFKVPASAAFTGFTTKTGTNWARINADPSCHTNGFAFYTKLGPDHTVNTGGDTIYFVFAGKRDKSGKLYEPSTEGSGYSLHTINSAGYLTADLCISWSECQYLTFTYEEYPLNPTKTKASVSPVGSTSSKLLAYPIRPVTE